MTSVLTGEKVSEEARYALILDNLHKLNTKWNNIDKSVKGMYQLYLVIKDKYTDKLWHSPYFWTATDEL